MSEHIDEERVLAYITETEMMYVKPVLGDKLFHLLLDKTNREKEVFKTLLDGGTYQYQDDYYSFAGLKAAISYFVFAKNVMVGDYQSTRYGIVMKDGDYSSHISSAQRSACYNDSLEVANAYLQDCIDYCKRKELITNGVGKSTASGGIKIKKIG